MQIRKYKPLFAGTLWVVFGEDPLNLKKRFDFNMSEERTTEELNRAKESSYAACFSVTEKKTNEIGILCILYDNVSTEIIAHESVHIADWFFEYCGINSEDYSQGNEHYAYTVGWAAGCIADALIKYKNDTRRE